MAVFVNRLNYSLPDSLSESSYNSVMMMEILFGSLVVISQRENRGSQFVEELHSLLDIIQIIVGLVRVVGVAE